MIITTCESKTCVDAHSGVFNANDWLGLKPAGHLFYELTWLLRAAQEWQVQSDLNIDLGGYSLQLYAMDAVFLRARALFEFFLGKGSPYCHAQCLFRLDSQLEYPLYDDGSPRASRTPKLWSDVMHIGSVHLKNRTRPAGRMAGRGGADKDLNQMPVEIAHGVVDVWEKFEAALGTKGYVAEQKMAKACLEQAIKDASAVVDSVSARSEKYAARSGRFPKITRLW